MVYRAGMKLRAAFVYALALAPSGCHAPVVSRLEVVPASSVGRGEEIVLRMMEDGRRVDLERARRALAAWVDEQGGGERGLDEVREAGVQDWPAPAGCAWVLVPDRLEVDHAVRTPCGRVVLARIDDGVDLGLREFEAVAAERLGRRRVLRLRVREGRGDALSALTRDQAGGVLLFVEATEARLAARVPNGLDDEVLLVGTTADSESVVLGRTTGGVTRP